MTLLFIHGAAGSPLTWHLQLSRFRDALGVELPGHPTGSGFNTIQQYADSVEEFIQKNRIRDPVLVGHSMGGAVAIEFALRTLSLVGLVLVGTGARLRVHPDILSKLKENYEEACRMIVDRSVSPSCDQVIRDRIAQEMPKVSADVAYGDFLACNGFDRMDDVERIHHPTLIVCGADDRMTPVKYSQYLHEKIGNSKLVIVPGAGHMVMLEKHRELNDAIEAFLSAL